MGKEQRYRRCEVIADPLATAVAERIDETVQDITWKTALDLCRDLEVSGCVLVWMFFNVASVSDMQQNSSLVRSIFNSGMKLRAGRNRSALPLCEGDFAKAKQKFQGISIVQAAEVSFVQQWATTSWTILACFACNVLDSGPSPFRKGKWKKPERELVNAVEISVNRMMHYGHAETLDPSEVEKELKSRRINYEGEEIGTCHKLTFEQVVASLPPKEHGGSIDVLPLVSSTTRSMLENPDHMVLPDVGQSLPKLQGRIHIEKGDVTKIADELVERGVCCWIPIEEVAVYRGQRIHNGIFGVPKPTTLEDGRPILRLIMNLVPSNAVLKQFTGGTKTLPHISAWLSTFIDQGEELRIWQSDMSSAFYLFRIPRKWTKYLSFNIVRRSHEVYGGTSEKLVCLACNVLPMGWSSSVSIMQELSESLLRIGGMSRDHQILRGSAMPLWLVGIVSAAYDGNRSWWHVYLDNFAAAEVGTRNGAFSGGQELHETAERLWSEAGVVSAQKKRKSAELQGQELGAHFDGSVRVMGPSGERMLKLIQATLILVGRSSLSRRLVQVVAGRWIHVMQYRRPSMSLLSAVWEYVSSSGVRMDLQYQVKREFFSCMAAVPLLHCFLGSEISEVMSASDASHAGGAFGMAETLTPEGEDFTRQTLRAPRIQPSPILVLSLFHGIGGSFRCYDILGIQPEARIAFDIHGPAMRVTARRWPGAELYGDVRQIDRSLIETWLMKYHNISEIHIWGGFPCTDLSSVNALGKGLAGKQSSLFYELKRIISLVKETVPKHIRVKYGAENVASMKKEECTKITDSLGVRPYHFNCSDCVPMQRPRLCWCSEPIEGALDGLEFVKGEYWTLVRAEGDYPPMKAWIQEESTWPGGEQGQILPTALKSIRRSRPPPCPAGINRCDEDCLQRWEADSFRYPPYHYSLRFLFWTGEKWRLCRSDEKELLLGYGYGHTSLCFSASKIKQSWSAYEDERSSLLGDSFSVHSFVIVCAALCRNFLLDVHVQHLYQRMGLAPGFVAPLRCVAPIQRCLQYGSRHLYSQRSVRELNQILLSKTNHTGSDVRVTTGEVLNPKAVVRQSIEAKWWDWRNLFCFKWKQSEHINILELRIILQGLRYYITHLHVSHRRIFHVTDSYICMSVISKGRTGSKQLARVLKKVNALLLGFGIQFIVAHVESSENPTDDASRSLEILPTKNQGATSER